jgi:hypothetical protein
MVIAELTLPLLAVMGINELLQRKIEGEKIRLRLLKKEVSLKKLIIGCFIGVGGFCLLAYLAPGVFTSFTAENEEQQMVQRYVSGGNPENQVKPYVAELMPQLEKARETIFKADALRSFIFIALSFGALFLFITDKIKRDLLFAALGIFIVIDLWTVDTRYVNEKSFISKAQNEQNIGQKTLADESILKDKEPGYRVLNLTVSTFNDAQTSYYHKSIGGYHGAKLKKYAELIEYHIDNELNVFRQEAGKAFANDSLLNALMGKLHIINMLNTKYFIIPGGDAQGDIPLANKRANGAAWLVKKVKTVADADEEILGLKNINTKNEAIAQNKYLNGVILKENYSANGQIELKNYKPNHLTYQSESSEEQFAVFSEIYYPKGWNAYVDGQLKPHAAVNYVLRGMVLPAGKHTIEFKFEPSTYKTGNTIAMAGSVLVLATVALSLYFERKKNGVIVS